MMLEQRQEGSEGHQFDSSNRVQIQMLLEENRLLREQAREARFAHQQLQDSLQSEKLKQSHETQLHEAQLKLKEQVI